MNPLTINETETKKIIKNGNLTETEKFIYSVSDYPFLHFSFRANLSELRSHATAFL